MPRLPCSCSYNWVVEWLDAVTDEFCFELAASLAVMLMEMKAELDDFAEMTHLEPEIELEGVH